MGKVRVKGHDYHARGYYFITIGTINRRPWLSRIECGRVVLEPAGELLLEAWGLKTYKPVGATATRWLASGRTLVLTGFPDDETVECSRLNCLKNNEWVRRIATAERRPEM